MSQLTQKRVAEQQPERAKARNLPRNGDCDATENAADVEIHHTQDDVEKLSELHRKYRYMEVRACALCALVRV